MLVILNAPAGAGKDTIGAILESSYGHKLGCFKQPMFDIAKAVLGETLFKVFMELYNDRETKEQPQALLGGLSCRQFMIKISEGWVKPVFGEEYFGERMLQSISLFDESVTTVTDGGFPRELFPSLKAGVPVLVFRLRGRGSFEGDSRNFMSDVDFLELPAHMRPYIHDIKLEDGNPVLAASEIQGLIKAWRSE